MVPFPSFGFGFLLKYTWSLFILLRNSKYYYMSFLFTHSCPILWPHWLEPTGLLCPWDFSRQEYWHGYLFPPLGDLPDPGIEPGSPALPVDSLLTEPPRKKFTCIQFIICVYSVNSQKRYYKVDTLIFSLLERKNHEAQFLSNLVKRKLGKLA